MPRRILLADAHGGIRQRVRSALEESGFEVCGEATDGTDAIEKTKVLLPDLIILNLSMPAIHELDAIPEIINSAPNVKIVIFSVDDFEELRRQARDRGAHAYISKLSPISVLIGEVIKLIGPG